MSLTTPKVRITIISAWLPRPYRVTLGSAASEKLMPLASRLLSKVIPPKLYTRAQSRYLTWDVVFVFHDSPDLDIAEEWENNETEAQLSFGQKTH